MQDTTFGSSGYGTSSGSEFNTSPANTEHICSSCGAKHGGQNTGLEQFLGRIGISEEMMNNLKSSMQSVDVEEYLNTARDYLKNGSSKATTFAKENPGKVAAGVAVLAVGAGLLISALNKD
jgi:hypothetical protein